MLISLVHLGGPLDEIAEEGKNNNEVQITVKMARLLHGKIEPQEKVEVKTPGVLNQKIAINVSEL